MAKHTSARRRYADIIELLGSMRFAISLLMFICIASVIGTVLQQNQAANTYVDRFGPFWFELLDHFAVWRVYNSWWFLLIMGFLVVSTSLCVLRNAPRMVRDMLSFREYVRGSSLQAFPHRVEQDVPADVAEVESRLRQWLAQQGYRCKARQDETGLMLAAKKGSANRLGYVFAHVAIVVICLGGLLDSELPVRLQIWLGGKQPITQNMLIADVPASGRLSAANPSFRANMLLPDGNQSSYGIINVDGGALVQPLPFAIKLERFSVDFYSTGMPSSFKSAVQVIDPDGSSFRQVIAVNEPLRHKGVTVYQSSFDDGGSRLMLTAYPLGAGGEPIEVKGTVGQSEQLALPSGPLSVQWSGLRVINVENMLPGAEPQPKAMLEHVAAVTGSAAGARNDHLRNVGPSVQYTITGKDGQSREYNNYMLPMELDGSRVFLAGVRDNPSEAYRYMRIPADGQDSMAEFMHLLSALRDPALRAQAAERFAATSASSSAQEPMLRQAALGALESFERDGLGGLIERVPVAEREKILGLAVPMIQLTLAELYSLDRARRGLPPVGSPELPAEQASTWIRLSLLALANLPEYPAPALLTLKSFEQVQASVFQVSRTPGKNIVYLGCLFLVLGVFSMFYIRDRRIWLWLRPQGGHTRVLGAMSTQRRTLDFEREFEQLREALQRLST